MVLKWWASNFFKPKDGVLKKKTVLYENNRPLQSINADECTVLQQCWKWQSVIGHCPTKFRNCPTNFAMRSDMTSVHEFKCRSCFPWGSFAAIRFASNHFQMRTDTARHVVFCCNTLSLHTNFYSLRQTVQIKLKTNVHVCFEYRPILHCEAK